MVVSNGSPKVREIVFKEERQTVVRIMLNGIDDAPLERNTVEPEPVVILIILLLINLQNRM